MKPQRTMAVALTVAGSDSGGGAGIQADLKTFRVHGVFGTTAITCITAQNPDRVSAVQSVEPRIVAEQMERVFEAFHPTAAKTGMLYDAAIVKTVARVFARHKRTRLVIDPLMIASSGARLLKKDVVTALTRELFPLATLVTPNLAEAELLAHRRIRNVEEMREAARLLAKKYGVPFLVKGGHLKGAQAVDVLFDGSRFHEYRARRVSKIKTHGTGCTYSAAIVANLAPGCDLAESILRAKQFVTKAIRSARKVGRYSALNV